MMLSQLRAGYFSLLLYSSFGVILSVLLILSLLAINIVLGIPNLYYPTPPTTTRSTGGSNLTSTAANMTSQQNQTIPTARLNIDQNYKEALFTNGNAFFHQGKYIQAIQYYDKVLAIDPNFKEALLNKGVVLYSLRDYTQAIQYYDKVLAIDPNNKKALEDKGYALSESGNYTQAIQYFDKVLAIDPNDKYVLFNKQQALSKLGNQSP